MSATQCKCQVNAHISQDIIEVLDQVHQECAGALQQVPGPLLVTQPPPLQLIIPAHPGWSCVTVCDDANCHYPSTGGPDEPEGDLHQSEPHAPGLECTKVNVGEVQNDRGEQGVAMLMLST